MKIYLCVLLLIVSSCKRIIWEGTYEQYVRNVKTSQIEIMDLVLSPNDSFFYNYKNTIPVKGTWRKINDKEIILHSDWQPDSMETIYYKVECKYEDTLKYNDSLILCIERAHPNDYPIILIRSFVNNEEDTMILSTNKNMSFLNIDTNSNKNIFFISSKSTKIEIIDSDNITPPFFVAIDSSYNVFNIWLNYREIVNYVKFTNEIWEYKKIKHTNGVYSEKRGIFLSKIK